MRRNHYFDPESEAWLDRQVNASAALRELIHERIAVEAGLCPARVAKLSREDFAAIVAAVRAEVGAHPALARVVEEPVEPETNETRTPPSPSPRPTGAGNLQQRAAKTAGRFM
jgi:hypothetical protein